MAEFNAQKVSKVKAVDPDANYSVEGADGGSFAIAASKKELKQLMKSDADVVYDEKSGKLFFNENGTAKGWGAKKVGGLVAKFKGKPELTAEQFEGLLTHTGDVNTDGGDIKDQITSLRAGLSDSKVSELYGETLIDPKKGVKQIIKVGRKEGYQFDKAELGAALDEMNQSGDFFDVELDDAALATLMGMGGALQQASLELLNEMHCPVSMAGFCSAR